MLARLEPRPRARERLAVEASIDTQCLAQVSGPIRQTIHTSPLNVLTTQRPSERKSMPLSRIHEPHGLSGTGISSAT